MEKKQTDYILAAGLAMLAFWLGNKTTQPKGRNINKYNSEFAQRLIEIPRKEFTEEIILPKKDVEFTKEDIFSRKDAMNDKVAFLSNPQQIIID